MLAKIMRTLPIALCAAVLTLTVHSALAQSGEAKSTTSAIGEAGKDSQRRGDEFAEAAKLVAGPAGNPECVWLGRRVVGLLWRDDLDTAFRHLDLYDRFGCPGPHIQQAFRCVVRQGNIDPKASPESINARINDRVQACWLNPAVAAHPAATSTTSAIPGAPAR
jgi:hypothetical protein